MGGGTGRRKWKHFFHRSSSDGVKPEREHPPMEFVCPIFGTLMADPVIVSSGQTFERNCVQACILLGVKPILSDGSKPDFSTVIPNIAIETTILNWCDANGFDRPKPPDFACALKLVQLLEPSREEKSRDDIMMKKERIAVLEKPPVKSTYAATEMNPRVARLYSSYEESVTTTTAATTPPPLATRPFCYSSSSSSSSEIVTAESLNPFPPEEEEIVMKLKSTQSLEQEQAVISLRKITRTMKEIRVPLCTARLLSALRPALLSRFSSIQINAVAALVNLSLEKMNKVKIVRSGMVPPIIAVLKGGFPEAQEHATGALFSLALDDENKAAIGVLGALPPLLHALRSESEPARHDSALALYHLSLAQSNRAKLVKLRSVPKLLDEVRAGRSPSRALLILCNLAACSEGRTAMIDANAVECLVGVLKNSEVGSESTRENCVVALYALSRGSMRFKALAKEAGAMEVLREVEERGSNRAREKAKRMLQMMRGGGREEEQEEEELDWEELLGLEVTSRTRCRVGNNDSDANSGEF